jgi:HK97 family phage portal protein
MKLSDRVSLIKAGITGKQNQSLLTMAQRFSPVYGEPPRRSTDDWINLYNKSPRMNPVHQIASDVATSAYGIYDKRDVKKTDKLKDNPIEALLKKPTPNLTLTEHALLYITQVYLLLPSGEAFWIKERNGLNKVTELWPVPPGWVNEIPSKTKDYFTIYPQGNMQCQPILVPMFDMVYFKKPDVTNPYLRGRGRAEGIGDEIETDEYMAKYQKRFFFNDAVPQMVGMMPGADEAGVKRQKELWQQEHGGYNNSNKVAWLNWDAKFQLLKETNKDMDFIESRKYLRDTANQHFSIPPELFGILENSNRSTIDAAYYLYTKNVLRKELKFIDDTLNMQLVPEFDKDTFLEHDNVVPEDAAFELSKATEGLKNGGVLVDEWRQANGWEPLPKGKGQVLYTPLNMIPTNLGESDAETANGTVDLQGADKIADTAMNGAQIASLVAIVASVANGEIPRETGIQIIMSAFVFDREKAERILDKAGIDFEPTAPPEKPPDAPAAPAAPVEPPKSAKKGLSAEQKNRSWEIIDKAAVKNEQHFVDNLKRYFQSQQDRIVNSLAKSVKAITDDPDELLDWTEENGKLKTTLKPLWLSSMKEGATAANEAFGFDIGFDVLNPKFLDWIDSNGAERVTGINTTTQTKLQKTLSEGIADGEGIPKLKNRVLDVMNEAKTSRAMLISKTETHNTVSTGTHETYKAAGVKKQEWLTSMDGRERESHAELNGEVVGVDESFSNGLAYPGDPSGAPEEVCNCRCTLLPVIE